MWGSDTTDDVVGHMSKVNVVCIYTTPMLRSWLCPKSIKLKILSFQTLLRKGVESKWI